MYYLLVPCNSQFHFCLVPCHQLLQFFILKKETPCLSFEMSVSFPTDSHFTFVDFQYKTQSIQHFYLILLSS